METLRFSFSLFWTRPSTKYFYKISQNFSFSATVPEHTNYNLRGQLVIHRTYNREERLMTRNTVILLLQQLEFAFNLKKSVLTPSQRIEFLGVTVDSLIMTLYLPEKKGSKVQKQCLELQVSILELVKLIGLLSSTSQAVLPAQINFRYLQQQQMQALKLQELYWKK